MASEAGTHSFGEDVVSWLKTEGFGQNKLKHLGVLEVFTKKQPTNRTHKVAQATYHSTVATTSSVCQTSANTINAIEVLRLVFFQGATCKKLTKPLKDSQLTFSVNILSYRLSCSSAFQPIPCSRFLFVSPNLEPRKKQDKLDPQAARHGSPAG